MNSMVYLDHNATAPIRPEARAAAIEALALTGNPSSVHRFGRTARRLVEDARERVAAFIGATPGGIVFTSGGTEANDLAIKGAGRRRVLISAVEHASVVEAAQKAAAEVRVIPVDRNGAVDLHTLESMLAASREPALISIMLANNETGTIQPIAEAAAIAHRFGALVHCDAVQAVGRLALDVRALGVDLLTISAHKLGGPLGAGTLVVGEQVPLESQIRGGGQESGRRAGTENVPAIAGFGAAAEAAQAALPAFSKLAEWRDRLEVAARALVPGARVYGAGAARLANTSCLAMPGVTAETQVIALDLAGIAVSAGAACSSGKVSPSRVLAAMAVPESEAACAIRVSLGWTSVETDINRFLEGWGALYARAGNRRLAAAPAA